MADLPNLFDNNATTQRIINSSLTTQSFANSATDNSYSLDPNDTNDYFRVQLSGRSSLILTLSPESGNADVALLDSSGNPVTGILQDATNGGTLADAIVTDPLDAGFYYIRVYTPDNNTTTNYRLSVNTISTSRSDLLWRNYGTGENILWQMNGISFSTYLVSTFVGDTNWRLEGTGDFNGDSQADYIWRNYANGTNVVWYMNGNAYSGFAYFPTVTDTNWNIEGIGDFNNDSRNDLVLRNYQTGQNLIWYMNGPNVTTYEYLTSVQANWQINAVSDFNGDNKPDIVWRDYTGGSNLIWLMNGASLSTFTTLPTVPKGWNIAGTADFSGDGKTDLVWRNTVTGENLVWLMNQTSYVTFAPLITVNDQRWQIGGVVSTSPIVDLAGNRMSSAFNIGTLNGSGIYADTVGTPSDTNDYYRFSLSSNSIVNLALSVTDITMQLIQDLNDDGIITTDAEILATITDSSGGIPLAAGSNYFVRLVSGSSTRRDYALNFSVTPPEAIDLAPGSFTLATTSNGTLPTSINISSPQSLRVNYSVQNNGPRPVGTFTVSFYLSRDNVITRSDRRFEANDVLLDGLSAGQTVSGFQTITLPDASNGWWGGDQTYYIGMIVDSSDNNSYGNFLEISESNNTASAGINITGTLRPDLVGDGLNIVQTSSGPSQTIRLTGAVRNIGNASTGTSLFFVDFYFSNDDRWDPDDKFLTFATFRPIPGLSRVTFDSTITNISQPSYFSSSEIKLPSSDWEEWVGNGTYYVIMVIDDFEISNETFGGRQNNSNYGRLINQYSDYDFVSITGAPNNFTTP